jgi:adenylate cyclase
MAAAEATKKAIDSAALIRRLRLASGLVLAFFVITHFLNHALGLIALEAMEQGRLYFMAFWRNKIGMYALYGALLTHLCLGLWSLYKRRPILRVPPWELAQLALGLSIPPILVGHVFDTHFGFTLAGVDDTYAYVLLLLWVERPYGAVLQIALLLIAWLHACIGLHYWLRLRPWYPKALPALYTIALLLPVLALLGFVQGGLQVIALAETPMWLESYKQTIDYPDAAGWARIQNAADIGQQLFLGGIALALLARSARRLAGLRRKGATVRFPDGSACRVAIGTSILEASRIAGRPHASVCGGRGRCSTCRVRIDAGEEYLPPPEAAETRVLRRIAAPPKVRLACQTRPTGDVQVTPLLPAAASARDVLRAGRDSGGREQQVAILFADLRGYTKLSEDRLPFDTVFLLNRYFAETGQAITGAGGRIDKFIGDGVMALFGAEENADPAQACRQALTAARAIGEGLDRLNRTLAHELKEPLRLAMGLHVGPAIVGIMGYGTAMALTAIGDAVNTASRLESIAKERDAQLAVSEALVILAGTGAGAGLEAYPQEEVTIRGKREPMPVRLVARAADLPG